MALDDVLGGIGGAIPDPVGKAVDFFAPPVETGRGGSIGSLLSSVGRGARNIVSEGPGAVATGAYMALNPSSGMSARDRLLIGGLATLGAGSLGRQAYRSWSANRVIDPTSLSFNAPAGRMPDPNPIQEARVGLSGVDELEALGDGRRFAGEAPPQAWDTFRQYPGMNVRQAHIVSATDLDEVATAMGRWAPDDEVAPTHFRVLFGQYADMVGGEDLARWDMAKFDLAMERNVFAYSGNEKLRKSWKKVLENPQSLFELGSDGTPTGITAEGLDVLEKVKAVAEATDFTGPDLSTGIVGRVERIEFGAEGPILYARQPTGWSPWSAVSSDARVERLKELNYRNLAEQGKAHYIHLYEIGIRDFERDPGARRLLPDELEVGPVWYPTARDEVADAFGVPRAATAPKAVEYDPNVHTFVGDTTLRMWGRGVDRDPEELLDELFGSPTIVAPWRSGDKRFNRELMNESLRGDRVVTEVDPRVLRSTQGSVTLPGMRHYLTGQEGTFEAGSNIGNRNPVVYVNDKGQYVLQSGHHRAFKALLMGEKLKVTLIDGTPPPKASDVDTLKRAVASVSFLSEAEDWSTNIAKAHRVMTNKSVEEPLQDERFLAWIRDPKSFEGKDFKRYEKLFDGIHKDFTSSGFKVSKSDLGVVLRLMGRAESVEEIFASTKRRKQKNFYLNIYDPDLEYPVTVDRHAFDAFVGFDTGINDRPVDLTMKDGDQVYDVVADTIRAASAELNVTPHELQAVVWEAWRMLKSDKYTNLQGKAVARRGTWDYNDPFFLPDQDSTRNAVLDTLSGRLPALDATTERIPFDVLGIEAGGLTAGLPDGSAVRISEVTQRSAAQNRHLWPAIEGLDRVPRWAPKRAAAVRSAGAARSAAAYGDRAEVFLNAELDAAGGHPLFQPGEYVTYEIPTGSKVLKGKGIYSNELGKIEVDRPELSLEHLDPDSIDPAKFVDPDETPLRTNRFVNISATVKGMSPDEAKKANNKLLSELKRKGYKPRRTEGRYMDDDGVISEEDSFLVFGVPAEEALELGKKYNQESVLTNEGFLYSDGRFAPVGEGGIDFDVPFEGANRTAVVINGTRLTYAVDIDWDGVTEWQPESAFGRSTEVMKKVQVNLGERSQRDVFDIAEELEAKGAQNVSIYANRAEALEGWERAYESAYSDGVQTTVVRTSTGPITSPNGGFVYTRNVDGLSDQIPSPEAPLTLADEMTYGSATATRNGQKVVVEAAEEDVSDALELRRQILVNDPESKVDIKVAGKTLNVPSETKKWRKETVLLRNGIWAPRPRRDNPLPEFAEQFGFDLDPGYIIGRNQRLMLPDDVIASLTDLTGAVDEQFGDAIRRFGLRSVTVSPGRRAAKTGNFEPPVQYAQYSVGDQTIILSKEWWQDIPEMTRALEVDRSKGILARNAAVTPESILAHEYGHVIHSALRANEGWVSQSRINKELEKIAGNGKPRSWRPNARKSISNTAGLEVSELVAEAFSEVMTGDTPSVVSMAVMDFISDEVSKSFQYRRMLGL